MGTIILIAVIVVVFLFASKGVTAARARNSIVSWATGKEGYCMDCKHCRMDTSRRFSQTDYVCSISKCRDITPDTRMRCFEENRQGV